MSGDGDGVGLPSRSIDKRVDMVCPILEKDILEDSGPWTPVVRRIGDTCLKTVERNITVSRPS